jgi:hypothetical protein
MSAEDSGVSVVITARIVFLRGLDKIESDQKRGIKHLRQRKQVNQGDLFKTSKTKKAQKV